jgi:hypothetical protein
VKLQEFHGSNPLIDSTVCVRARARVCMHPCTTFEPFNHFSQNLVSVSCHWR